MSENRFPIRIFLNYIVSWKYSIQNGAYYLYEHSSIITWLKLHHSLVDLWNYINSFVEFNLKSGIVLAAAHHSKPVAIWREYVMVSLYMSSEH